MADYSHYTLKPLKLGSCESLSQVLGLPLVSYRGPCVSPTKRQTVACSSARKTLTLQEISHISPPSQSAAEAPGIASLRHRSGLGRVGKGGAPTCI